jgi:beta-lactamase superfamily II metal-dependent hydrolase
VRGKKFFGNLWLKVKMPNLTLRGVVVTVAKDVLWPSDSKIILRLIVLYVGQGSSVLAIFRDGSNYKAILIDINLDEANGGLDVPKLMKDLLGKEKLFAFVNTHPHDDHLKGLGELCSSVEVERVWHSGHTPGRKHAGDTWKELQALIKKVEEAKGEVVVLEGSRTAKALGDAQFYVLAPAAYVSDEIDDEDAETRYQRIHEQCSVLRIGIPDTWILVPGDADKAAFENFIAKYHAERLSSVVLIAPHHGSRSFFKLKEEEEPYLAALEGISPDYVVLSAPKADESKHEHPHDDAVEIYKEHVGDAENVLHTGAARTSFICDIYEDGQFGIGSDDGALTKKYGLGGDDDGGGSGIIASAAAVITGGYRTRIDDRPMGG